MYKHEHCAQNLHFVSLPTMTDWLQSNRSNRIVSGLLDINRKFFSCFSPWSKNYFHTDHPDQWFWGITVSGVRSQGSGK